ncbi:LysM peptidoglycan-binding domain-containing protein, partial [Tetragenococcus halophilus]
TWKSQTSSYTDATAYLTGRYATDPDYGQKLNALIEAYNLTQFDTPAQAGDTTDSTQETEVSAASETTSEKTQTSSSTGSTYTVQQGDTLWDIAQNQGISLDELMANNGLTDQMVTVGQQLNV